jgi:dUTP pyrophosphatase
MSKGIKVRVMQCRGCEDLHLPAYQTDGAAGMDLLAAVEKSVILEPGDISLISAGIRLEIPEGFEGQVRPRSGLALHHGIGILNGPGTIDSDYRGIVGVILFNLGKKSFTIKRGDRIAQLVFARVQRAVLQPVHVLCESGRKSGGFGSTGKK